MTNGQTSRPSTCSAPRSPPEPRRKRCRYDVHASRDAGQRLHDILAAIVRIKQAELQLTAADDADNEPAAQVAFDAVLYNLVVIGEAVNALPPEITLQEPDVPWRDIVDMRNFLSHEYFRVLSEVVRHTIDEPLEQLRVACERLCTSATGSQE